MLKSRFYPFGAILVCLIGCAGILQARPGETRSTLERRLLADRTAVKVSSRDVEAKLDDRSVPYKHLYDHLPEGAEHEIYFKPAENVKASQGDLEENRFPDGWEVHVIYFKDRSVFEAYRRNGSGITRFEQEGLLSLNKGQSFWKKVDKNQAKPSAIGYEYERDDGEVRALRNRNYFILYLPEFDELVFASMEEKRTEDEEEAKEKAPDSLAGF